MHVKVPSQEMLVLWSTVWGECRGGVHQPAFPESSSRLLDVCAQLGACPSGQCFNISRWASFTWSLGAINCLGTGPWGGWIQAWEPFMKNRFSGPQIRGSQDTIPHWFSKFLYQRLISLVQILKVGVPYAGFEHFALGRSSRFWVPSHLGVTKVVVGFMTRLCLSLSYPLWCGFLLFAPFVFITQPALRFFFFKRILFHISCRLRVSLGVGECSPTALSWTRNHKVLCSCKFFIPVLYQVKEVPLPHF